MAMTAAERQRRYRERNGRNAGKCRINLIISSAAAARLDELARQHDLYKQEMLERIIYAYDALRGNNAMAAEHNPDREAQRLLLLAGGDVEKALRLLTKEAVRSVPNFTWKKAASKKAPPICRNLYEVRRSLCSLKKRTVHPIKCATKTHRKAEGGKGQLEFDF